MSDTDDLAKLEDERRAAMLGSDTEALDRLLHDELAYVHSTGGTDTKDSYIGALKAGTFDYKALECEDRTIKVHSDIGMVFYHMIADVEIRGTLRHLDNRVLAVWVREAGQWRLLAVQSGAIPEPAP